MGIYSPFITTKVAVTVTDTYHFYHFTLGQQWCGGICVSNRGKYISYKTSSQL